MHDSSSLSHVRWECKYHVVIVPKYRKKTLYGGLKKLVGEIIRELCRQKGVELLEGHLLSDHIHMLCTRVKVDLFLIRGVRKRLRKCSCNFRRASGLGQVNWEWFVIG